MGEMGDPRLHPKPDRDRAYVAPALETKGPAGNGELPWYSIFRVKLSQLVTLGTILVSLTVAYYKVQAHELEITTIKATAQTKDAAASDQKLILQRLDDLEKNVNRRFDDMKEEIRDVRTARR
jgi:hypothetical protein